MSLVSSISTLYRFSKAAVLPEVKPLLIATGMSLASITHAQGIFDFGTLAPTPGAYDVSQLTSGTATAVPNINYYVDSGNPGQTFTMGNTLTSYTLTNLYIKEASGSAGGGMPQLSAYTLRIYSVSGTVATLLTTYVSTNQMTFTQGDWIQWTGLTNVIQANATYAYALSRNGAGWWMPAVITGNPYSGGAVAVFPTAGGTLNFSGTSGYDAAFDLGCGIAPVVAGTTSFSPISPVYVGTSVTVSSPFSGGVAPYIYDWQKSTDGGITYSTDLGSGNGNGTYSLNTSGQGNTTTYYRLIVTDSESPAVSVTNVPAALYVSSTPLPPTIVSNTTITPPAVLLGGSAIMSATFSGTAPVYYQWVFSATNNGSGVVNIAGATNSVFIFTNAQYANAGYYSLVASNTTGATNSSFALFSVQTPVIVNIGPAGGANPTIGTLATGTYDIAQLSTTGDIGSPGANKLNYFDNNGTKPGQSFTTGSNPLGYSLGDLYYKCGGPVINNGSHGAGVVYTLRIYSLTNATQGSAILISTYTNQNTAAAVPNNVWAQWTGLTNILAPNKAYAYSISASSGFMHIGNASNTPAFYNGGLGLFPTGNGAVTFATASNTTDTTFLLDVVPAGYPDAESVSMSPTNGSTVFSGAQVALSVAAIGNNIGYVWQVNNGGGYVSLPNSDTSSYTLDTTPLTQGTYQIQVLVTNSFDTNTSSALSLTVIPAIIQSVNISPANNSSTNPVYAGTPVTLSASVQGNNLTYYWQTDGGSGGGLTNIPNSNTTNFVLNTAGMAAGTYQYDLLVSNASGTVISSEITLNLVSASPPVLVTGATASPGVVIAGNTAQFSATFIGSQPIFYQWYFTTNGGGTSLIAGATNNLLTLNNAQVANAGTYYLAASNNPPGLGPQTANSAGVLLYVVPAAQNNTTGAIIADGGTVPYVGNYDISQLTDASVAPPSLNYYVNAASPPGQVFVTGNTPPDFSGYPLSYVYLKMDPTGTGNGNATAQSYTLRVYQMLDATNAQLLTSYVTANSLAFTAGDWIRVGGLTNILQPNTAYAISLQNNGSGYWRVACNIGVSPDPEGQAVSLPTAGGAVAFSSPDPVFGYYYDAAYVVGLTPLTAPIPTGPTTIVPSSIYAGQGPVTMQAAFIGSAPIYYHWQFTDTNNVTSIISGATNSTYTIAVANYGNAGTYSLLASNGSSSGTNVAAPPATLTVLSSPQTFVMNFSKPAYSGAGVVGSGASWNQIVGAGAVTVNGTAGTAERNTLTTATLDDGTTPMPIQFTAFETFEFTHGGGIALLDNYMLLQGQAATNLFPFTFSNCIPGVYNLVLYGNNGSYGSGRTVFTAGGVSQTNVNSGNDTSFAQGVNYASFYNIAVTNGTLTGYYSQIGNGAEAGFNGAQLQMAYSLQNPQLFIATQPASETVSLNQPASVSVVAEGPGINGLPGPLFYQWWNANGGSGTPIIGATNSTYIINTSLPGTNDYYVVITNLTGLTINSFVATVGVFVPDTLSWRGLAGSAWDTSTVNWSNVSQQVDSIVYADPDYVVFDDTASSFSVSLAGTVMPSSVVVNNNNNDYLMMGTGSMGGGMRLTMNGTATLTISNDNSYTGGTVVNSGTLVLAEGGGTSPIVGTLSINPAGTVNLSAADALGYNAGVCLTNINITGGVLTNGSGGNEGFNTTFNLTGGTISSSGGAYNLNGASGSINSLATNIVSTISANVALRASGLTITTAKGTVSSGGDLNISGVISGGGDAITKSGAGTLTLSGTNTYSGLTTVGNGTLLVNGTIPGAVTVNSGAVLGGIGTIGGVVTIGAGAILGTPGIATLTLNSSPVIGGTVVAEINRNGGSPLADKIVVVGNPVAYGGSLVVSNTGTALQSGDVFTLFTATAYGGAFTITNLPSLSAGLVYSFANGVLSVVPAGPNGPGTITNSLNGNTLSLSWPVGQGWRLQMQTNGLTAGLGTNWIYLTSSAVSSTNITINPNIPTVFYRLTYP